MHRAQPSPNSTEDQLVGSLGTDCPETQSLAEEEGASKRNKQHFCADAEKSRGTQSENIWRTSSGCRLQSGRQSRRPAEMPHIDALLRTTPRATDSPPTRGIRVLCGVAQIEPDPPAR